MPAPIAPYAAAPASSRAAATTPAVAADRPVRCLLTVHTGETGGTTDPAPGTGDVVLVGRLPPERVEPVAEALGLGTARRWLARVPADLVAVVNASGVRWIRVGTPEPTDLRRLSSVRSPPVNGVEP